MDDARYRIGLATARILDPEGAERLETALKEIAPDLYRLIVESAFGDILSRPGPDPKTREIATVSALTGLGNAQPQLRFHLNAALNALYLAKEVFAERDAKGLS